MIENVESGNGNAGAAAAAAEGDTCRAQRPK